MLEEYALVPDIFDSSAYSKPDYADMCLAHLKEPLLREALVRDLCNGAWSCYCRDHGDTLHRLTNELLRKLERANRLCRCPQCGKSPPVQADAWCQEALSSHAVRPLSGVIAAHATKGYAAFSDNQQVCSIEKLAGTTWFQNRSSSYTVDRKSAEYLKLLDRVLRQANSLMFIDPNLNPGRPNYREFASLLEPLAVRNPRPRIELHRSFCDGQGAARRILDASGGRALFNSLDAKLKVIHLSAEVFLWQDFHDRYLITDIIGASVAAGFDVTRKPNDMTTWARLGRSDRDNLQRQFDPAARPNDLKAHFWIGE